MKKLCPYHNSGNERTPSLHIYPDGGEFCFACGHYKKGSGNGQETDEEAKFKEDIEDTLSYISGLPRTTLRGLEFPTSGVGYYLMWPGKPYYKLRLFSEEKSKYRCPPGHSKPLYVLGSGQWDRPLWIVEGEINALSLKEVCEDNIVSPGGVGDFCRSSYLTDYTGYGRIVIAVDNDAPGAKAAMQLKAKLVQHTPDVSIELCKKDFNQILCDDGKEGLQKAYLELRTRMRLDREYVPPLGMANYGALRAEENQAQEGETTTYPNR